MKKVEKTAITAVLVNSTAFMIKFALAIYSGSIALKAEAFHSLTDVVASVTIFVGLIIANRKTRHFPYGLYKMENLVSIFVGVIIIFAGYEIASGVFRGTVTEIRNSGVNIAGVFLVILMTYGFSRYESKVGKETGSPGIAADAKHFIVDVTGNILVLITLLANYIGVKLDKAAAVLIVLFIVWSGGRIIFDAIRVLLDVSLDNETLAEAEKIIMCTPQVIEVKSITGRNSGQYKFIETNIILHTNDFNKAHSLTEQIEKKIKERIQNIDRIIIHYEPQTKETMTYALPVEDKSGERISAHFGEAPYFNLVTVHQENRTIRQLMIKNPFTTAEQGKGILAAEWLNKYQVDIVIIQKEFRGKGPLYVFSDMGVKIINTDEEIVSKVLDSLGIKKEK